MRQPDGQQWSVMQPIERAMMVLVGVVAILRGAVGLWHRLLFLPRISDDLGIRGARVATVALWVIAVACCMTLIAGGIDLLRGRFKSWGWLAGTLLFMAAYVRIVAALGRESRALAAATGVTGFGLHVNGPWGFPFWGSAVLVWLRWRSLERGRLPSA